MARAVLTIVAVAAVLSVASGLRPLDGSTFTGRQLLDINLNTTTTPFTITAFGTGNQPGGNCYIQGYPGGRADSTQAGPLTVSVPTGSSLTISFQRTSDSYFANYNYSGDVNSTSLNQNSSYGLISATYSPKSAGQSVTVFSGLVSGSNPITQPTCLVNITFASVNPASPPPSPSPPPTGGCNGYIPCYCQNGYCFNNGATLSNNCAPPSGQTCTPASVNPADIGIQYAYGYSSPASVCKCTATSG